MKLVTNPIKKEKTEKIKKIILADNVSGWEGCIFLSSVIFRVLEYSDIYDMVKFNFYGITCENDLVKEYIKTEVFKKETDKVIAYIEKNPWLIYFWNRVGLIKSQARQFERLCRKIKPKISSFSDEELQSRYNNFVEQYFAAFGWGAITFVYELIVSEILLKSLSKRFDNPTEIIHHYTKSNYKSFMIESEEFIEKTGKSKNKQAENKLRKKFLEKFFYLKTNYHSSKVLDEDDLEEMLEHKFENKDEKFSKINVKLEKKEKAILNLLKASVIIRDLRKKINLMGGYIMYRFLEEVSKRKKIPEKILRNAFWFELMDIFDDSSIINIWKNRKDATILHVGRESIYSGGIWLSDRKKGARLLKGLPASAGKAKGTARIIQGPKDFHKFHKSEILVTFATRPEFVTIMKKSAAILTQEGGITSHAAIVARELGIPCIVGISGLMDILKDNQEVEVDADKGTIKILKRG
jgi:phosphohistidine swiveling domain-containing protein